MKILLSAICLFAALFAFGQDQKNPKRVNNDSAWQKLLFERDRRFIGKQYDSFSFTIKGDSSFSNADISGKVTFINFWFETCPPCVAEFEALNRLYLEYKNDNRFTFVSFTSDSPETATAVKQKYNLQFPIISIKKEECYRLNQQNGFPTSIILTRDGVIHFIHTGGSLEKEEINTYFNDSVYPAINAALAK
jgi:thiol-disulfide isomerase/thioredoxin